MKDAEPEFVLGAMLPDFTSMLRLGPFEVESELIRRGVALHHETDEAFHGNDSFVELSGWTTSELLARGVGRGGARAVGHIGVELLLDGTLLPDPRGEALYLNALHHLAANRILPDTPEDASQALSRLASRIASYGSPSTHSDPESVTERLIGILRHRPRLRIEETEREATVDVLRALEPKIALHSPHILQSVLSALRRPV